MQLEMESVVKISEYSIDCISKKAYATPLLYTI